MTFLTIITWLIIGLVIGAVAHLLVPGRQRIGIILTVLIGIVGALVGGFIFNALGHSAASGINLYSIFVAFIGAVVVLVIYHAVTRSRAL